MGEVVAVRGGQLDTPVDVDGAVEEHLLAVLSIVHNLDGIEAQERSAPQTCVGGHASSKKETPPERGFSLQLTS